jgi:hypothetical protein
VERILEAVEKKQKIVIYSYYDADGIPGGVVLHNLFEKIDQNKIQGYQSKKSSKIIFFVFDILFFFHIAAQGYFFFKIWERPFLI